MDAYDYNHDYDAYAYGGGGESRYRTLSVPSSSKVTEEKLRAALKRMDAHEKARKDALARLSIDVPSSLAPSSQTDEQSTEIELMRLITVQKRENKRLQKLVHAASSHVADASARSLRAEASLESVVSSLRSATTARLEAEEGADKLQDATRVWKGEVGRAEREVRRAREEVMRLEREELDAEREAERARRGLWREREEDVMRAAKEEGRREGVREGRRRALAELRGEAVDDDDGYDDYDYESEPPRRSDQRQRGPRRSRGRTMDDRYTDADATYDSHEPRARLASNTQQQQQQQQTQPRFPSPLDSDDFLPMDAYMDPDNPDYVGRTGIHSRSETIARHNASVLAAGSGGVRPQLDRIDTNVGDGVGAQSQQMGAGMERSILVGNGHGNPRTNGPTDISLSPGPTLGAAPYRQRPQAQQYQEQQEQEQNPNMLPIPSNSFTVPRPPESNLSGTDGGDPLLRSPRRRLLSAGEAEQRAAAGWEDARGAAGLHRQEAYTEEHQQYQQQPQDEREQQSTTAAPRTYGRSLSLRGGGTQSLLGVISSIFRSGSMRGRRSASASRGGSSDGHPNGNGNEPAVSGLATFGQPISSGGASGRTQASPRSASVDMAHQGRQQYQQQDLPEQHRQYQQQPAYPTDPNQRTRSAPQQDTPTSPLGETASLAPANQRLRVVNSTEEVLDSASPSLVNNHSNRASIPLSTPAGMGAGSGLHTRGSVAVSDTQRERERGYGEYDERQAQTHGLGLSEQRHGQALFPSQTQAQMMLVTPPTSPPLSIGSDSGPSFVSSHPPPHFQTQTHPHASSPLGPNQHHQIRMPPYRGPKRPRVVTTPALLSGSGARLGSAAGSQGAAGSGPRVRTVSGSSAGPSSVGGGNVGVPNAGGSTTRGLGSLW